MAKSRDLTASIALALGIIFTLFSVNKYSKLVAFCVKLWALGRDFHSNNMIIYPLEAVRCVVQLIFPFFFCLFLGVFVAEAFQAGISLNWSLVGVRTARLNPLAGLKRIFGLTRGETEDSLPTGLAYQISKTLLVLAGIVAVSAVCLLYFFAAALAAGLRDTADILALGRYGTLWLACGCEAVVLVEAVIDVIVVRRQRIRRLSLDAEQFKREMRESEGDVQTRMLRREMHRCISLHGIAQGVRRAKVVVINRDA